jgi:hypothetical protein
MLQEPAARNFLRWPTLNEYIWPNPVVTGSYQGEVARLRAWLEDRLEWMDGAMADLVDTVEVVEPPIGGLLVKPTLFTGNVDFWFDVKGYQRVTLAVYDALGRQVFYENGFYSDKKVAKLQWDGSEQPLGTYFYKLTVGQEATTGKLVKY